MMLIKNKIKYYKSLLLLICLGHFTTVSAQKTLMKIVVDQQTLNPIEYVDIVADDVYTITNKEGRFELITISQNLKIRRIGYKDLSMQVDELSSIDTIKLFPKLIELQEVIIEGNEQLISKIVNNTFKLQSEKPYLENFFLRITLKKDGSLFRLMDVSGRIHRKKIFVNKKDAKKNIKVEILNTRKAGLVDKSFNTADFRVYDFAELYYNMNGYFYNTKRYNFDSPTSIDEDIIKVQIHSKNHKSTKGHFLIDLEENIIKESYMEYDQKTQFEKRAGFKWRNIYGKSKNALYKDSETGKLHVKHSIRSMKVEVFNSKNKRVVYDIEYSLFLDKDNSQKEISSNYNPSREIFKIDAKYDEAFWENQNYLPLTEEMKIFINNLTNVNKREFKTITNISND